MERDFGREEKLRESRQLREIASISVGSALVNTDHIPYERFWWKESVMEVINPYADLAEKLYREFNQQAILTGDKKLMTLASESVTQHGFNVIAKILSFAPRAYKNYLSQTGKPASIDELSEILKRSSGVTRTIASEDNDRGTIYESNLGLLNIDPLYEDMPFVIEDNELGEAVFTMSPLTARRTKIEIIGKELSGELDPVENYRKCPALGIVLESQWNKAVDMCVQDPALFTDDLSLILQAE